MIEDNSVTDQIVRMEQIMQEFIYKLVNRQDLTAAEMTRAMETIMTGEATDAQIGAFITAMRMKGETVTEIAAAARVMRAKATRIPVSDTAN